MAHLDLTHFHALPNPFATLRRFGSALREAILLSHVAQDALSRGITGDELHAELKKHSAAFD